MRGIIITLFFSFLAFLSDAQSVANYVVTRTTGNTYNSIFSTGNAIPSWRNNGTFSQDDNRSDFVDIGFDFWYDGTRYTQFCVSTNGFLDFSSSTDDGGPQADDFGYDNSSFSVSNIVNATRPAITPFYDDLTAQGGNNPLGNSIRYLVSGIAPNRTLTVEWINMAVYQNTTPSLNFQAVLYETSGLIEFNYGTMTQGTHNFSYTCGINAPTMNATPTAAQLKIQQTANTATFNQGIQHNLSAMPQSGSRITFNPPTPANPGSTLTFTAVQQTSMTLNWTNWASNEVGYVVYYSYDGGIEYFFGGQTAVNATSLNLTGLWPGTTYQYRVYAVTEGRLSNPLTGSQATLAAGNKVSAGNGNWNQNNSWVPTGVPTAGDNVTILNTHTITLNVDGVCNNLTVGSGASGNLVIGNNGQARTLTINGNLTVANGGILRVSTTSNTTHKIDMKGKIQNNGTLDLRSDANSLCDVGFNNNQSQAVAGNGLLCRFNSIILNIGSNADRRLDVTATNLDFPSNFLTLTNGTFHLNTTQTSTFVASTGAYVVPSSCGIWLEGSSTLSFNNSLQLNGNLRVSGGILNVGNAANLNLNSNGGNFTVDGGTVNIAGRYFNTNVNTISNFTISSGTINVPTVSSTSTTESPFTINSPGASFNMSGGTIVIQREGGSGAQDLGFLVNNVSFSNVTGGTLQLGVAATPANSTMKINSSVPIGNISINRATLTAILDVNSLVVRNNINIVAGTLNANNLNITFGGSWNNSAAFVPGTSTVTFNGSGNSFINHTTTETFHHLTVAGSGSLTTNVNLTINGNLTILSSLDVSAANRTITLLRNWINNGSFNARAGMVNFSGTVLQNMSGTASSNFYDLTIQNNAGVTILNGNYSIEDALFLNNGLFNVNAASAIRLRSDANRTARIAPVVSGSLSGNFIVERFISNRNAGYSDMSSPVQSSIFADWGNELTLIYAYNPPYAYPSAYSYSESLWDYVPVTNAATVLTPGKGFEVYLDTYANYTVFEAATINTNGQPNTGTINISSSLTRVNDGWNLVGNPFASFLSWNSIHATATQVSGNVMIYDETINDFASFNLSNGLEIAPHQGFWIEVTGTTPNFTFRETHKTVSTNSSFRNVDEVFTLRLSGDNIPGAFTSNAQFVFSSEAINGIDEMDVTFVKVPHPFAPVFCSQIGSKSIRKNYLSENENQIILPLRYAVGLSGTYTIQTLNEEILRNNNFTCAILVDQQTGNRIDLFEQNTYTFEASISDDENRFMLILSKTNECDSWLLSGEMVSFLQTPQTMLVQLNSNCEKDGVIRLYNHLGQELQSNMVIIPGELKAIALPATAGIYHLSVEVNGRIFYKKFFTN